MKKIQTTTYTFVPETYVENSLDHQGSHHNIVRRVQSYLNTAFFRDQEDAVVTLSREFKDAGYAVEETYPLKTFINHNTPISGIVKIEVSNVEEDTKDLGEYTDSDAVLGEDLVRALGRLSAKRLKEGLAGKKITPQAMTNFLNLYVPDTFDLDYPELNSFLLRKIHHLDSGAAGILEEPLKNLSSALTNYVYRDEYNEGYDEVYDEDYDEVFDEDFW